MQSSAFAMKRDRRHDACVAGGEWPRVVVGGHCGAIAVWRVSACWLLCVRERRARQRLIGWGKWRRSRESLAGPHCRGGLNANRQWILECPRERRRGCLRDR